MDSSTIGILLCSVLNFDSWTQSPTKGIPTLSGFTRLVRGLTRNTLTRDTNLTAYGITDEYNRFYENRLQPRFRDEADERFWQVARVQATRGQKYTFNTSFTLGSLGFIGFKIFKWYRPMGSFGSTMASLGNSGS